MVDVVVQARTSVGCMAGSPETLENFILSRSDKGQPYYDFLPPFPPLTMHRFLSAAPFLPAVILMSVHFASDVGGDDKDLVLWNTSSFLSDFSISLPQRSTDAECRAPAFCVHRIRQHGAEQTL